MPRIDRGNMVILLENILSLEIDELLKLYKHIISIICQGFTVSFLLEPIVARIALRGQGLHPMFLVLNYGSIVCSKECVDHIIKVLPQLKIIELLDPIWAKVLSPKCASISICGMNEFINKLLESNNLPINKVDNVYDELNICYGECCSQILSNLGLTTSVQEVSGKIILIDKNHFITYGFDEILRRLGNNDVNLFIYSLNEYEKAPLKPLVGINNLPIVVEVLGKPYIAFLMRTSLNELDSYLQKMIMLMLLRSIIYVLSQIK